MEGTMCTSKEIENLNKNIIYLHNYIINFFYLGIPIRCQFTCGCFYINLLFCFIF